VNELDYAIVALGLLLDSALYRGEVANSLWTLMLGCSPNSKDVSAL
jgi:hypothetical protein